MTATGRVLEVDTWLNDEAAAAGTVVECHPEISFAELNGGLPVPYGKKTWAGHHLRRDLLEKAGIVVPADLGTAGERGAPDDVLDAAAAAWTARRVATGAARSLPDRPEPFGDRRAAIVY
ncbi:DUF429 domain-containing protein [Jiangella asiatica]|nr:DUF429 domain-containing protein [Jiangella asiatica]